MISTIRSVKLKSFEIKLNQNLNYDLDILKLFKNMLKRCQEVHTVFKEEMQHVCDTNRDEQS